MKRESPEAEPDEIAVVRCVGAARAMTTNHATALFVDLHEHGLGGIRSVSRTALRRGVGRLAALVRLYELPAIVSGMPLPDPSLLRELDDLGTATEVRVRTTGSAFDDQFPRTPLLLAGVATEGAILLTALAARAAGHDVSVVVDACGGIEPRTEQATLLRLSAAGVPLTSTWTLALELQRDFAAPRGRELMGLVQAWLRDQQAPAAAVE